MSFPFWVSVLVENDCGKMLLNETKGQKDGGKEETWNAQRPKGNGRGKTLHRKYELISSGPGSQHSKLHALNPKLHINTSTIMTNRTWSYVRKSKDHLQQSQQHRMLKGHGFQEWFTYFKLLIDTKLHFFAPLWFCTPIMLAIVLQIENKGDRRKDLFALQY